MYYQYTMDQGNDLIGREGVDGVDLSWGQQNGQTEQNPQTD